MSVPRFAPVRQPKSQKPDPLQPGAFLWIGKWCHPRASQPRDMTSAIGPMYRRSVGAT